MQGPRSRSLFLMMAAPRRKATGNVTVLAYWEAKSRVVQPLKFYLSQPLWLNIATLIGDAESNTSSHIGKYSLGTSKRDHHMF